MSDSPLPDITQAQETIAQTVRTYVKITDHEEIANAIEKTSFHSDRPDMDMAYGLQPILQRPGHEWTWWPVKSTADEQTLRVFVDLMLGDLRVQDTPNGAKIWRRTQPPHLTDAISETWVPLASLATAYGIRHMQTDLQDCVVNVLRQLDLFLVSGMTFHCKNGYVKYLYVPRTDKPTAKEYRDGKRPRHSTWLEVTCRDGEVPAITRGTYEKTDFPGLSYPTTYTVETHVTIDEAPGLADRARAILVDWTDGSASSIRNLMLMPAAAFLRDHPEQAYVITGPGGVGKSSLTSDLRDAIGRAQTCEMPLELLAQTTSMSAENKMMELGHSLVAVTDDFDSRTFPKILAAFKTLLTGTLPLSARRRGQDAIKVTPIAVHIITANNGLPLADNEAEQRRFANVVALGGQDFWEAYGRMRDSFGFWPFMMASGREWVDAQGEHLRGPAYTSLDDLDDNALNALEAVHIHDFVDPTLFPGVSWKSLGLTRKSRRDDKGAIIHVYAPPKIQSSALYQTWKHYDDLLTQRDERLTSEESGQEAGPDADEPGLDMDMEVTDISQFTPLDVDPTDWSRERRASGDETLYVTACPGDEKKGDGSGKVVTNWKKAIEIYREGGRSRASELFPPNAKGKAVAAVAGTHTLVIDFDVDKHEQGLMPGLELMERSLGARIGDPIFPMPFLERSPSGGSHGAYLVPDKFAPYFKKAGEGKRSDGVLIDTRFEDGGYVIAMGSSIKAGDYVAIARPQDGRMPTITQPMLEALDQFALINALPLEYTGLDGKTHTGHQAAQAQREKKAQQISAAPTKRQSPNPYDGFFKDSSTPWHEPRVKDAPYTRGNRHNQARDHAWGIAAHAQEHGWTQEQVDRAMDQIRENAGTHDHTDTERLIKSAAEAHGFRYTAR